MGNMEPRRLHETGEEMGEKSGGMQEVPSCLFCPSKGAPIHLYGP